MKIYLTFLFSCILLFACNRQIKVDSDCINSAKQTSASDCEYAFVPVCGCNGLTYRNACFANASGLISYTEGLCPDVCIDPNIILPDEICYRETQYVCGCDEETYLNPCMARKSGVLTYTKGKCGSNVTK